MNYEEAVSYIESIPRFTSKTDLAHTARLLAQLGNPDRELPHIIHVAGTNGKGSVCAYLNSSLMTGGFRCGLFTSPHLNRINERIQIDGEPVEDAAFLDAFRRVMEAAEVTMAQGDAHPTYFEVLFLMAVVLFAARNVDYTILETGMGGRLDQTNVVRSPDVTVITSISRDHMEYLGETIREIAAEKAGIIKPGVPVIADADCAEAAEVIRARAAGLGSPLYEVTRAQCECLSQDADGILFRYTGSTGSAPVGEVLRISSIADYQMVNAALARTALAVISGVHGMTPETIREGIRTAHWPCRMECLSGGIVIDGAHNEDGMAAFVRTAVHFHQKQEITILFAAVADKEYPEMIRKIAQEIRPEHVVTTGVSGSRRVAAETFAEIFAAHGCADVTAEEDTAAAFQTACGKKGSGMLFCVGSLYLAGEIRALALAE